MNDLNFLFDTGAVPSAISTRVASRIGVTGRSGALALLQRQIDAQYVTVSDVRLGSIHAPSLAMVVVDLARLEGELGIRIDAVIGLDLVPRQNIAIDYKRRKIVLGLERTALHESPAEIYTFEDAPYWVVTLNLGGRDFRVLLDTGADALGLFNRDVTRSFLDRRRKTPVAVISTDPRTIQSLQPQAVAIGDTQWDGQTVVVLPEPPGEFQKIDGVMGPRALRIARLELDWAHKCLRWERE
jgi:predicted aspartyl protease